MTTRHPLRNAAISALLATLLLTACFGEKPEAMIASAKDYLAKNDNKAAIIQIKNALQKVPDSAEARFLLGKALLATAQLPKRRDKVWDVELAPLTRLQAWAVPEIKAGAAVAVLGFTFTDEKGDAVLRAEYLFVGGKAYGLRSSPA